MSAARVGCGKFARMGTNLTVLVNTDCNSRSTFCAPRRTSEWEKDSAVYLRRTHAVGRNGLIIFHCSFPIKLPHFETRDHNRNFTCFPTCPFVSHGPVIVCVISTLKSWSVPSCRVSCCPATTYGVCLQSRSLCHVLLRHVMPVKPQHGRFQGATTLLMT